MLEKNYLKLINRVFILNNLSSPCMWPYTRTIIKDTDYFFYQINITGGVKIMFNKILC